MNIERIDQYTKISSTYHTQVVCSLFQFSVDEYRGEIQWEKAAATMNSTPSQGGFIISCYGVSTGEGAL